MITPTCYSSRFCARYTYSFSRDDSPANVFEDNRMIWLALRFLKSKKISPFLFYSPKEDEILTMRKCNRKTDLPISHLFSCFFFFIGLVVRSGIQDKRCLNSLSNFITQLEYLPNQSQKCTVCGCPYPLSALVTSINYTRTWSSCELTNPPKTSPKSIQNSTVHDVASTMCFIT